jgi:Domain of unknown function (DUF4439)
MGALDTAWQAALVAEQRAVFGYGVLGPRLAAAADRAAARTEQAAHVVLQAQAAAALAAAGQEPAAPAADYPDLYPVRDPNAARALALRLEEESAAAWRYLYAVAAATAGSSAAAARREAQAALIGSAVRALRWRGRPVPFPGI